MIKRIVSGFLSLLLASPFVWAEDFIRMSESDLSSYAQNKDNSVSSRAEAVITLGQHGGQNALVAIARASRDEDPELRLAAIQAVQNWQGVAKWDVVSPLLNDSDEKVQAYAGRVLVVLWRDLNEGQQKYVAQAVSVYLGKAKAELSEYDYLMENALIYQYMRDFNQAINATQSARALKPEEEQPYLYLSDIYRDMDNNAECITTLKQGIRSLPESARMHYALGLAYVRQNEQQQALKYFEKAKKLEPESEQYQSVYTMALYKQEPEQGIVQMKSLYKKSQNPRHLYSLCHMYKERDKPELNNCINELEKVAPAHIVDALKK